VSTVNKNGKEAVNVSVSKDLSYGEASKSNKVTIKAF
jgi:hypothetical protein